MSVPWWIVATPLASTTAHWPCNRNRAAVLAAGYFISVTASVLLAKHLVQVDPGDTFTLVQRKAVRGRDLLRATAASGSSASPGAYVSPAYWTG